MRRKTGRGKWYKREREEMMERREGGKGLLAVRNVEEIWSYWEEGSE